MTKIKICGLHNIETALAACEAGADAIGFVFYEKSVRNITPAQAAAIIKTLPPFVVTVGLFVNPSVEYVREILEVVPLSCLQFQGQETDAFCAQFNRPFIKALHVKPGEPLPDFNAYPNARGFLLDTFVKGNPGGTGQAFDWTQVPRNVNKPLMLAGGLNADNVQEAIRIAKPYAVDVSSGVESAPGVKSIEKIKQFCERVKSCQ